MAAFRLWTVTSSWSALDWRVWSSATNWQPADRSVIMLDSEPLESIGGQAYWSLGGLFMVNSSEQRRLRIHDSEELALADWLGSAAFDRGEDYWPRRWAEAYVQLCCR